MVLYNVFFRFLEVFLGVGEFGVLLAFRLLRAFWVFLVFFWALVLYLVGLLGWLVLVGLGFCRTWFGRTWFLGL